MPTLGLTVFQVFRRAFFLPILAGLSFLVKTNQDLRENLCIDYRYNQP